MKVVCIKNNGLYDLTIGKPYVVIKETMMSYVIISDHKFENWYFKEYFKTLSEIRNEKIDKLLGL